MTVAALLLAAGESTRMGEPKPLLEWQGATLIEYQVEQARQVASDIVVVLGSRAEEVRSHLDEKRSRIVLNKSYEDGRASSVRAGAHCLDDNAGTVVVINIDQPRPVSVIKQLLNQHTRAGKKITVPLYSGKRGHPTVFDGSLISEMREVRDEEKGLRALMRKHADDIHEVEFGSDIVLLDLNDHRDYERALRRFANEVTT